MIGDDDQLIAGHFEHGTGKEAAVHIGSPALAADRPMIAAARAGETEFCATDRSRASPMAVGITV
jgi:hypothetical protein